MAQPALAENILSVVVDYAKPLLAMIAAGGYDQIDPEITESSFPKERSDGMEEVRAELVPLGGRISSQDVSLEFGRMGTLPELLAVGANHPDEQRKYIVVALGSVSREGFFGNRHVVCLASDGAKRVLGRIVLGDELGPNVRLLAVRKPRAEDSFLRGKS